MAAAPLFLDFKIVFLLTYMAYYETINSIKMSFGNVLSRLYDALQFCSYKHNDAAILYLQFCFYANNYWKKGNKRDEEYSLLKHERLSVYIFH